MHAPDVVKVGEDEGLLGLESASNDILGILEGEGVALLELELGLEEELLVVCQWSEGQLALPAKNERRGLPVS